MDNHAEVTYKEEPDDEKWSNLFHEFTDNTTLHGLRYVFMRSTWLLRRIIWFLVLTAAIVGLVYLNALNVERYIAKPKKINMDVSVKKDLKFPAVTICNYNFHKFTSVVDLGLYDAFNAYYDQEASQSVNGDWYYYHDDICIYDEDYITGILYCSMPELCGSRWGFPRVIKGISGQVCEHMCSDHTECTGFFYNRNTKKCALHSGQLAENFTANVNNMNFSTYQRHPVQVIAPGNGEICEKDSMEYYSRIRHLETPNFLCTFDLTDCPQLRNSSNTGFEKMVIQNAITAYPDYSLGSGRGRYLYMYETNTRPGSTAYFETEYFLMKGSCLEFYYLFIGNGKTNVKIALSGKTYGSYKELDTIEWKGYRYWKRFYKRIPDGEGSVKITINRPKEESTLSTGMQIDSFAIQPCHKYELNCLQDPKGITYAGNISVTETGKNCSDRVESSPPRCHNTDAYGDKRPWCFTDDFWEYCNIPHCGCNEDEFWCRNTKRCIPKKFTCDGEDDCGGNRQDEIEPCAERRKVHCTLDTRFSCGYESVRIRDGLDWEFKHASEIMDSTAPEEGDFMYVSTDFASAGDRAILRSPPFDLKTEDDWCLQIVMHSYTDLLGVQAQLEVFLKPVNQLEYNNITLKTINLLEGARNMFGKKPKWEVYYAKLPQNDGRNATFYLDMIYTMGIPTKSNIALKAIKTLHYCPRSEENVTTPVLERAEVKSHLNCTDFSNTSACPLLAYTTSANIQCSIALPPSGRGPKSGPKPMEGIIQSRLYPDKTETKDPREVHIITLKPHKQSAITLNFDGFDLVPFSPDLCSGYIIIETTSAEHGVNESQYCTELLLIEKDRLGVSSLNFEASKLTIKMAANGTSYPIFHGTYKVIADEDNIPPSADMICATTVGFSVLDSKYDVTAVTDVLTFDRHQCLSYSIWMKPDAELKIILAGKQHVEVYHGKHHLKDIPIPKGTYRVKFLIEFPITPRDYDQPISMMKYITITPGLCYDQAEEGDVSCDFTDIGLCGYSDFTSGNAGWIFSQRPRSLDLFFSPRSEGALFQYETDNKKQKTTGKLLSPWFETEVESCINVVVGSSKNETEFKVYVLDSLDFITNGSMVNVSEINLNRGLNTMEIQVSPSSHYVMLAVVIEEEEEHDIFIDEVKLAETHCGSPENSEQEMLHSEFMKYIEDLERKVAEEEIATPEPESGKVLNILRNFKNIMPLQGAVLPKKHKRRDYSVYFGVDEVFEKTEHNMEDLIFNCHYNEQPCDLENDFIKQRTESGICYTFNAGGDNRTMKEISTAGSTHGLRLFLNSEAYEVTKGFTTDSGVKIHIHDQNEIPFVHMVGLAAPLSHHTYFAITLKEFISLGHPYGNCGTVDLNLFPNASYTRFRCNQQCLTKRWERECGCRNHYMPGDYDYCTFQKYLKCFHEIAEDTSDECFCPTSCNLMSFATQSSLASLSREGVTEMLLEKSKIDRIQKNYEKLLNFENRMLPEPFLKTYHRLSNLMRTVRVFNDFISRNELSKPNSRFSLMKAALAKVTDVLKEDLKSVNVVLEEVHTAEKCFKTMAISRARVTQKIIDNLELVTFILQLDTYDNSEVNALARSTAQSIDVLAGVLTPHECLDIFYSELLQRRSEEDEYDNAITYTLEEKSAILIQIIKNEKNAADMKTELKDMLAYFKQLALRYERKFHLSTDLQSALSLPDQIANFSKKIVSTVQGPSEKFRKELVSFWKIVSRLAHSFQNDHITASRLAATLASIEFWRLKKVWKSFRFAMENDIVAELMNEITNRGPQQIHGMYMRALKTYAKVAGYLRTDMQEKITSAVSSWKIWQEPIEDLDNKKLILFLKHKAETENAMKLPLKVLVENKAPLHLQRILARFSKSMFNEVNGMIQKYDELFWGFEEAFRTLNNSLNVIAEKSIIDEDFIVKNFLRVDVFYDELTHEIVEQTPAYELSQFFSELGGYLGLLVGASVITICEFLDLIFHYAVERCQHSSKNKNAKKLKQAGDFV